MTKPSRKQTSESPSVEEIVEVCAGVFSALEDLSEAKRIEAINALRLELSKYSPFRDEPVDCVQWVPSDGPLSTKITTVRVSPSRETTRVCWSGLKGGEPEIPGVSYVVDK